MRFLLGGETPVLTLNDGPFRVLLLYQGDRSYVVEIKEFVRAIAGDEVRRSEFSLSPLAAAALGGALTAATEFRPEAT